MDLNVEISKIQPTKDSLIVIRLMDDKPVSSQMRDSIMRITNRLEEELGWRPLIISCTKDVKWETLAADVLKGIGLQRIPGTEVPEEPFPEEATKPLASPVSPEKLVEWEKALARSLAAQGKTSVHQQTGEEQKPVETGVLEEELPESIPGDEE